ncbi:hypothetical protein PGQ11_013371 [Apiospora arundinis]|uniref:Heterokaryon incompatibility domain-containing protein n=1 Tax=Apiospora arundinis TaxID=335852 RepID=A0ABR2HP17_9PEZI
MVRRHLLPGQHRDVGQHEDQIYHEMNKLFMGPQAIAIPDIMLSDNSIGATRGWEGPLLFVPTKAHVIRPPHDLSARFTFETDDENHTRVWVDDPEPGAEVLHESVQLHTEHMLCTACKDILNYYCEYVVAETAKETDDKTPSGARMTNTVVHHASVWSLCAFAVGFECYICSQIWDKVHTLYPYLPQNDFSQYRIECCWPSGPREDEVHKMWFVMVDVSLPKVPMRNYKHVFRMSLWPKAHFAAHFDKTIARGESAPDRFRGARDMCTEEYTNDCRDTRSLAQYWFNRCMQDADRRHGLCNRRDEEYLPTRLLDVRYALEEGKVRLLCPAEQPGLFEASRRYASLSHCWGSWGAEENPVLLSTNLADRKLAGLPWGALPKTFQDAFKIASWLELEWLWIDSLCIVQDSKSDWQNEASAMDRVYMNAEVNISADAGEDSRAGCFAKREDTDITPLEFTSAQTQHAWVVMTQNLFSWMKSATSLSRAWIHRERQLARRILHFTEKELVWECCGHGSACFASESVPGGLTSDERFFGGEAKFQNKRADVDIRTAQPEDAEEYAKKLQDLHDLWNSTCEGLSNKSVTYPTDMPIILSSLAREFHQMIPDDEYVSGLWRSTLPQSLTWWVTGDKPNVGAYIAPSWSWLCAASPVKLKARASVYNYLPAAEILEIKSDLETDDPYGRQTSAELHMKGYLRRLRFYFTEVGGVLLSVVEEDERGQDRIRLIGPDWNEEEGWCFSLSQDAWTARPCQASECYAFFTTFREWAQDVSDCDRIFEAILLEKVEERSGGDGNEPCYFRRIGQLDNIRDEYSLKLRYRVAPHAQIPEAGELRAVHVENPTGYGGGPQPTRLSIGEDGQPEEKDEDEEEEEDGEASNDDENQTPVDIWAMLQGYLRHKRWAVVKVAQEVAEKERRKNKEPENVKATTQEDGATPTTGTITPDPCDDEAVTEVMAEVEDDSESTGDEAQGGEEDTDVMWYIQRIQRHPSSGLGYSTTERQDKTRDHLTEARLINSQTVAYGAKQEPEEVIYQFDDALELWMEKQGILPWLQRLETTTITLV